MSKSLLSFLDSSVSVYHATENILNRLEENGFEYLDEKSSWKIEKGKNYYLKRNNSSVIAFKIGAEAKLTNGFNIVGVHTDSPGLKIKPDAFNYFANFNKIGVEVYGGPILSTWFDRPLSIAGRIVYEESGSLKEKNIDFKEPIAIIPNLAIHLNRDVNKGFEYNKQLHLSPLIYSDSEITLNSLIKEKFNIKSNLIEADLFFYDVQKSCLIGPDLLSASKIDNLSMCDAILESIISSNNSDKISVAVFYDNEEIGSMTYQGAASNFLKDVLERISVLMGVNSDDYFRAIASSYFISADGAHAVHPNFKEKHDENYMPKINSGPVIKMNANFRYASTAETIAYFISICERLEIPYQKIINRSDIPAGSTIGPVSSAGLGIKTIDIGNAMLAMHSIREVYGLKDHNYMISVLKEFYNG